MLAGIGDKIYIEIEINKIESELIITDNLIDLEKQIDQFLKKYKIEEKTKKEKIKKKINELYKNYRQKFNRKNDYKKKVEDFEYYDLEKKIEIEEKKKKRFFKDEIFETKNNDILINIKDEKSLIDFLSDKKKKKRKYIFKQ